MSDQPHTEKKYKKSTLAVVALRVERVLRLRLEGMHFHEIRDYADKPDKPDTPWNVSDSQLKRYIQKADDLLSERQERGRRRLLGLHKARRESLYAMSLKVGDFRTALAVLQDSAKLSGLYPDNKGLDKQIADLLKRLSGLEDHSDEPETPCERHQETDHTA